MKQYRSIFLLALISVSALAETPLQTEEQKTLYSIGHTVMRSLAVFDLTPAEFEIVRQGLADAYAGKKPDFETAAYGQQVQELAKVRRKAAGDRQAEAGRQFLDKAAGEPGAVKTESGMVYLALAEGNGGSPKAQDIVTVNYRGTTVEGREFDSSYKRGKPLEFKLSDVIRCWTEGVQKMKPGGKAKLVCPPQLAYGEKGAGDQILPGATLAFEVELVDFKPGPEPKAPVAPAPAKPAGAGSK
jgi:FKBP-type peptidyl-prolyl cis-trans isomerase FkpA